MCPLFLLPHKECSSSPINHTSGGVYAFCEAYGIHEDEELTLDRLGFKIGMT
jgi:hypothetical protein